MKMYELPQLLDVPFQFVNRGTMIPCNRRPVWRLALVVMLLKKCSRGEKSSIARLHILDWAIRNTEGQRQLLAFLEDKPMFRFAAVRYDPALLRALLFGKAEDLIAIKKGKIQLIDFGKGFAAELEEKKDMFVHERVFMQILGKRFTETAAVKFLNAGGLK